MIAWLLLVASIGLSGSLQAQAVCAEVKIQIQQRLSLERQAFDAVLKINNGLTGVSIVDLGVDIKFFDALGNEVAGSSDPNNLSATFFTRLDDFEGDGSLGNGTGVVPPQTSADARWLIIPSANAGGETPVGRRYGVGAEVSYRRLDAGASEPSDVIRVTLAPEQIVVRPQPRLLLDYFLPFDVHGDDPFTPEIEPSEPFTLGVRVKNVGYGDAINLSIESAQPEIIENELGLLVNFEILGGYVQNTQASPSLLLNFGDIDPGGAKVGRWNMITSLSGQFRALNVSYTHADTLGGALTSLIANPDNTIPGHRLIKDVLVDLDGRDEVHDFLAFTAGADGDASDTIRVYESEGLDTEVFHLSGSPATIQSNGVGAHTLSLGTTPVSGELVYVRLPSPYGSQLPSVSAMRADGSAVPVPNAWVSKSRVDTGGQPGWEYHFNLFDARPQATYTIVSENVDPRGEINGRVYVHHDNQPPDQAPPLAGVVVLLEGVAGSGATISRTTTTAHLGRFRFADLPAAVYQLQVAEIIDYTDGQHIVGTAGGSASSDRIEGIALSAGQIATGYSFVKLPIESAAEADLALSMQGPLGPVTVGEVFPVTLTLSNAGPASAQAASVSLNVPAGLAIQSGTPTTGTFQVASGTWLIDGLEVATTEGLTVQLIAGSPDSHMLAATSMHLTANIVDPDLNNNSASAVIEAELAKSNLSLSVGRAEQRHRALALITCGQSDDPAPLPECDLMELHAAAGAVLDGLGIENMITESEGTFLAQLRSGYWNTYWISSAANPLAGSALSAPPALPDELVDELAAYIHAGDTLLVEGGLDQTPGRIEQLVGSHQFQAHYSSQHQILVEPTSPLPMGDYQLDGYAFGLISSDGIVLAGFPHRAHAATEVDRSYGRAIVLGFRLVDMPIASERMLLAAALFDRLTPVSSQEASLGDEIRVGANVGNGSTPSPFTLTMQAQGPDLFLGGNPVPSTVTFPSPNIAWVDTFVADTVSSYVADLQLLTAPALTGIDITLVESSTSHQLSELVAIQVLGASEFVTRAHQVLASEQLTDPDEIAAQIGALGMLADASAFISAASLLKAKDALLTAMDSLALIGSVNLDAVRSDVGKAIRLVNRFIDEKRATACPDHETVAEDSDEPSAEDAADQDESPQPVDCGQH